MSGNEREIDLSALSPRQQAACPQSCKSLNNVTPYLVFFPVVAVALDAVALGERLPFEALIGLALILAEAFAVSSRAPAKPP